jgi:hypothetical protein
MAIIFNTLFNFNAGEIFHFGSISCIADQEGILHRIADASGKKSSLVVPKAAAELPHTAPARITPTKSKAREPQQVFIPHKFAPTSGEPRAVVMPVARSTEAMPLSRWTPLSTLPCRAWTWITRRREACTPRIGATVEAQLTTIPTTPPFKEDGGCTKHHTKLLFGHPLHPGKGGGHTSF